MIFSKNSIELTELASVFKVSLGFLLFTGSIRNDPFWTSRENSLEWIEVSSVSKYRKFSSGFRTSRENSEISLTSNYFIGTMAAYLLKNFCRYF